MTKRALYILFTIAMAFAFVCCDDDEEGDYYPSLTTDFVVAATNNKGLVKTIIFEDGNVYDMTSQSIDTEVPDTTFRCISSYTKKDGAYEFYQLKHVFSDKALPSSKFKENVKNPVKVVSVWKGRGYINMRLGVLTTGQASHSYGFSIDSLVSKTTYVSLIHKRPENDAESYTETVYMSLPLTMDTDSVSFTINTYDGPMTREFYTKSKEIK